MKKSAATYSLWLSFVLACLFIYGSASFPVPVRADQKPKLPAPTIHQMMKNVAWNELQASEHPKHYYCYIQRSISSSGSRTTVQIATPHGDVNRLIEVNHHPPDKQQLLKNQQLLVQLSHNKALQQSRFRNQQSNLQRRDNVIKDMPDAFIYTYIGQDQKGLIELKFRPAPNFQPTSRQSLILKGMAGKAWVDPKTQRIAKIDGKLIQDVTIGWGFLARLNAGGTFLLEESQGSDGTRHQKLLSVHFDGTEFLIKHIHIHETEVRCCFEPVSDHLSIREAVRMIQDKNSLPKDWQERLDAILESAGLD